MTAQVNGINATAAAEKKFNATIKAIRTSNEKLAGMIHEAGLFALRQVNIHGNAGFAERLIEALGKKHDVKRVSAWLFKFGKLGSKDGKVVFRKRKDIGPENVEAMLEKAANTPYWELTPATLSKVNFDYLAMLKNIISTPTKAEKAEKEGKEVTIANEGMLAELKAVYEKHTKAAETAQAKVEGKPNTGAWPAPTAC